jgi:hypothetical protein
MGRHSEMTVKHCRFIKRLPAVGVSASRKSVALFVERESSRIPSGHYFEVFIACGMNGEHSRRAKGHHRVEIKHYDDSALMPDEDKDDADDN